MAEAGGGLDGANARAGACLISGQQAHVAAGGVVFALAASGCGEWLWYSPKVEPAPRRNLRQAFARGLSEKSVRSGGRYVVVVYREVSAEDGFVVTAFVTTRPHRLERRRLVWPPQQK